MSKDLNILLCVEVYTSVTRIIILRCSNSFCILDVMTLQCFYAGYEFQSVGKQCRPDQTAPLGAEQFNLIPLCFALRPCLKAEL